MMRLPDPELMYRLVRRHTHDVRNRCSGIDLDAALLGELSEDPEIAAMAGRLKRQVARIESDIRLLLLKLDEPQSMVVPVGDLLQLWRLKLQTLSADVLPIRWPEASGPPVSLDSRLVVHVLCDLTLRAWDRNPSLPMEVQLHFPPGQAVIALVQSPEAHALPAEYLEETTTLLAARNLQLAVTPGGGGVGGVIRLGLPLEETMPG